jgi:hypothetical protein
MGTERIALSQRERDRLKILYEVQQKHLTQVATSQRLKISDRQVRRMLVRLRQRGTFTKVEEFGGGFFDPLNGNTGTFVVAPECARRQADGTLAPQPESETNQFVEAGTTEPGPLAGTRALPLGVTHWQCCIHPWMRINVVVRDSDHDH